MLAVRPRLESLGDDRACEAGGAQSGTGADFNVVRWCSTRSPAESAPVPDFKSSRLVAGTFLSAVWIVKQLLEPLAERFGVAIEP